jgi:hypothetical protein
MFATSKGRRRGLRDANVAEKFAFRQGLWIEDLRIPPGQECSNGSLILLAVVLWRIFSAGATQYTRLARAGRADYS